MPINPNEEITPETSQEAFTARTYDPMQPVPEEAETKMEAYIKYLYDKTQRLPEKPDTREEYFMMIAGQNIEPGGNVEPLNVTANGTYSETGKAYSPVIVNVPLPSNANERKSVTSYPVTDSANYPLPKCDVTVSNADKCEVIVTNDGQITEDSEPYLNRHSAGGNTELDEVIGGTVAWNQLAQKNTASWTINNVTVTLNDDEFTITSNNDAQAVVKASEIRAINNHVYFCSAYLKTGDPDYAAIIGVRYRNGLMAGDGRTSNTDYTLCSCIGKADNDSYLSLRIQNAAPIGASIYAKKAMFIDLTQLFSSTIADYIHSLEQATAGSGIAWLKSCGYLTEDYYAYQSGKLESVNVARHKMVGFNQWDEQWTTSVVSSETRVVNKNPIRVIPNETYYFTAPATMYINAVTANGNYVRYLGGIATTKTLTIPSDVNYIGFSVSGSYGATYNNDICINISDASKNGTYEPYHEYTYPLDSSLTLRGIPKLNASNQLYYDGDRYEASGRVKRKYGIVDLGTLTWTRYNFDGVYAFFANVPDRIPNGACINDKYSVITERTSASQLSDKTMATNVNTTYIYVRDDSYYDAASFTTAMSGIMLVYGKATPTYEDSSPFEANQIVDANGTEEYIDAGVEAGIRDVAIPVGHETKYYNGKAYVKPLTAGTSDTVSMADMGIMPTSPMYIEANGTLDVEYWKSNS